MEFQTMKLDRFILVYCQDIIKDVKTKEETIPDIDFTYDYKVPLEDGGEAKVINAGGYEIDINDILTLSENDFAKAYPGEGAMEAYKNYLSNFIILEGEEVLSIVRKHILRAHERIERYSSLDVEAMDCKF